MPKSQLNQVLNAELGPDWSSNLHSFDYEPLAAASIGQVCIPVLNSIVFYLSIFHHFILFINLCAFGA